MTDRRVADVMRSAVRSGPPEAPVAAVVTEFSKHGIGSLVVMDESMDDVEGIVTETDVIDAIAADTDLDGLPVAEIQSAPVVTVERAATVAAAAELMDKHAIRRLPVVDDAEGLVGIVTSRDLTATIPSLARAQRDEPGTAADERL